MRPRFSKVVALSRRPPSAEQLRQDGFQQTGGTDPCKAIVPLEEPLSLATVAYDQSLSGALPKSPTTALDTAPSEHNQMKWTEDWVTSSQGTVSLDRDSRATVSYDRKVAKVSLPARATVASQIARVEADHATRDTVPRKVPLLTGTVSAERGSLTGTVRALSLPSNSTAHSPGTVSSQATVSLKLYRCFSAQDGHSFAEERLYNALWHSRHALIESDETRLITVGWDLMSKLAGMTPRNAKENCLRLIQKLAVEKVESHRSEERIGTTYRLYSYNLILQRRRRAGLEWITRNRGGVAFVTAPTISPRDTVPLRPSTFRSTVPSQATVCVPSEAPDTVPSEATPLDKDLVNTSQTSSSQTASVVSNTAKQHGVMLDDDAVRTLIGKCRNGTPGATEQEIAHFTTQKITQLRGRRNVENWVGMLLVAVPLYFSPPATELTRYRQAKAAAVREGREAQDQLAAEVRRILDDPHASDADKAIARDCLPGAGDSA